jgi:hypothetical protein
VERDHGTHQDRLIKEELWKCRSVESVEIQRQDFPSFHDSLGISQKTRDSHIPTAPTTAIDEGEKAKEKSGSVGGGKVEIQKQDSHFPTAPTACGSKEETLSPRRTRPSPTAHLGALL